VVLRLACDVALGVGAFGLSLLALWVLAGRPAGAERILLTQAGAAVRRLRARLGEHAVAGAASTKQADV
jgi:hypothetical protein